MSIVSVPKTTFNIVAAPKLVNNAPQSILFVGQKTSAGSATAGALTKAVGVAGEEDALFGEQSFLAAGIRAFRKINTVSNIDAIALDDVVGVNATGSILVAGPATDSGTIKISVQSVFLATFTITIASGDTAATIATAINAAISARTDLIFTSGVVTDTVTFTCVHDGTIGNDIIIKIDGNVAGVTLTTTAFAGGATDPSLTNLFDVTGEIRYQSVCYPSNYSLTELKTFLDDRFNVFNKVLDGVSIISITDTTAANFKATSLSLDSESLVLIPNLKSDINDFRGGGLGELDYVIQAKILAIRALRLTDGAVVSQFIAGSTANARTTGGIEFATIPYHNTPIPDSSIVDTATWWTEAQQNDLNSNAVAMIGNNIDETDIILGDMITTKQGTDETFKFLNAVDGSSGAREYFVNNNRARYAQTQLTQGDLVGGLPMANAASIKLFQIQLYDDLGEFGIVPIGSSSDRFFKENLTVSIDFDKGAVTIDSLLPLVVGLRSIVGTLRITFDTNG